MDTFQALKPKKKESENNTEDFIVIDGVRIKMAPDLKGLPEIDYDDPDVKKWLDGRL